jgi:CheY-like chemotaxis protein
MWLMPTAGRSHAVAVARTVADALAAFEGGCCDVNVSDLWLPDGTGWDLLEALRRKGPVRGIVLSGLGDAADVERSHAAGFERHRIKPVDVDAFIEAVESLQPATG